MDEFDFIAKYLAPLAGPEGLGLLDDAALFTPREGYDLVLTKDTMVEGIHFPKGVFDDKVAGKLLRVNLSDLAAKGAKPVGYLLSIALPEALVSAGESLRKFAKGLERVQDEYDFKLFGGDTVRGTELLTISATFIGEVPRGKMVKRSGAKTGDDIWVSGAIGDAYLGLMQLENIEAFEGHMPAHIMEWRAAYWSPRPRLELQDLLGKHASASVDVSDGLVADAGHIAAASHLNLEILASDIPLSSGSRSWVKTGDWSERIKNLVTGGDDYEVIFTAPQSAASAVLENAKKVDICVTRIGRCKAGLGVDLIGPNDDKMKLEKRGYSHF